VVIDASRSVSQPAIAGLNAASRDVRRCAVAVHPDYGELLTFTFPGSLPGTPFMIVLRRARYFTTPAAFSKVRSARVRDLSLHFGAKIDKRVRNY
jgi:hypothetical protein